MRENKENPGYGTDESIPIFGEFRTGDVGLLDITARRENVLADCTMKAD